MILNKEDISILERIYRLNLVNSLSGIKPANLIGTRSLPGESNLAIFSSVFHLGSNPPLMGMIVRPTGEVPRHTFENIKETGHYTINHISVNMAKQAHYTSAKFKKGESEFVKCGLTEEYISDFPAPFVMESKIKMGLKLMEQIHINSNKTIMLVGHIELVSFPEEIQDSEGHLNLESADIAGISGLNSYYSLKKEIQLPYARPDQIPDFGQDDE